MKFELFGYKINLDKKNISKSAEEEIKEALAILAKHSIEVPISKNQTIAAAKATQTRQNNAKRKIEDAVNLLRLEGKKISEYAVAKESGCSINTVKKYREFIKDQK